MDYYAWKDGFNTGIEEIDRQHRAFLDCLNDCYLHVSGEKRRGIETAVFDRLQAYAATHFRFEEEMMRRLGYRELERQRQQHRYFETQIAELKNAHVEGEGGDAESVLAFLREWLLKHILEEDRQLAAYVD